MMQTYKPEDNIHKAWLYRILEAIAEDEYLTQVLYFKGGTCASMLGFLDRFSVDLDFDYAGKILDIPKTRSVLEYIFLELGLDIKDQSKTGLQYFLRYANTHNALGRNTIKIDVSFPLYESSVYEPVRLIEIEKIFTCQTKETMFAHKLVALIDRFEKTQHIAGRDLYDIHYFFMHGFTYNAAVIAERTGLAEKDFFAKLIIFVEHEITEKIITEDLSPLLSPEIFKLARKTLKREVLVFLRGVLQR